MFTVTLDQTRIQNTTGYLSVDGVKLTFDSLILDRLHAARDAARSLGANGLLVGIQVHHGGPEVEFEGVDDLYRLEDSEMTVNGSGQIYIRAEVRHGSGEALAVRLRVEELDGALG